MEVKLDNFLNLKNFEKGFCNYKNSLPFSHAICDNFLKEDFLNKLVREFSSYDEKNFWNEYNNQIEVKKTCNEWNKFKKNIYTFFSILNSIEFVNLIKKFTGNNKLYPDYGLNGGGLHSHKSGGKLNMHLDYNIHPKIDLQRKINFLIYVTPNWKKSYGGELGFWSQHEKKKKPFKLIKTILPKFNRAVFFDTTMNSWHGLVNEVRAPKGICRNSFAAYYLTDPPKKKNDNRSKALFAPSKNQENDKEVLELIKKRSNLKTAYQVYLKK